MSYLLEKYTSPAGVVDDVHIGQKIFSGDLLEPHRDHIRKGMFHGFDFDATMLRIASMNLLLHGLDASDIHLPGHTERQPFGAVPACERHLHPDCP
jgi:type I restriction enzyme M protein